MSEQYSVDIRTVFPSLPGSNVLVLPNAPHFTIVAVSEAYLTVTERTREALIGKGLFEVFPNNPEDPLKVGEITVRASMEYAVTHKEPHHLPVQRYDILNREGKFEERYWSSSSKPILNDKDQVIYLVQSVEDVTETVQAQKKQAELKGMEKAYSLLINAPIVIGLAKGENLVLEMANEAALQLWNKTNDIIGKPLLEGIPELAGQGVIEMLQQVRTTGQPYQVSQLPVRMELNGETQTKYYDILYQPYYDDDSVAPTGVFTISHDVTAQVLSKQQVQTSEDKYRSLFESMDQGLCVVELLFNEYQEPVDYRFIETNPVFEKQTGIQNAPGKTIRELMPATEPQWLEKYGRVALTGEPSRFRQHSEGTGKWFDVYAYRIGGPDNRQVAILFTDITEAVSNQKKVEESEQQVRALVESAPFPIGVYIGREMRIAFLNQSIIDVWGKGPDIVGKRYAEVLPELADQNIYGQLDEVYLTGKAFHAKNQRVDLTVDGKPTTFYFNYSFTPLFDSSGKVYGVMNTAADVTDLVQALEKVKQSEENIRSIIVQAPVAMCILSGPEHIIDIANEEMIALWGKPKESVIGKPVFSALPDAREQGFEAMLDAVFLNGDSIHATERQVELIRHGKPETTYQNFVYTPYRNSAGAIVGVLAISSDVTQQVLARRKVEEAEQKARLAIESADLGTYELDLRTNEVISSPRFRVIWQTGDRTERDSHVERIHPDDLAIRQKALAQLYATGNIDYEVRLKGEQDQFKWVKIRGHLMKSDQGEPERIIGVAQDISEQKQFAEELKKRVEEQTAELVAAHKTLLQTNEYYQNIIDKFDAGFAALVPVVENNRIVDFQYKKINQAYSSYTALSPLTITGKRVSEVFPDYYKTDAFERYVEVYESNEPQTWELHYNFGHMNVFLLVSASRMNDEVIVNFTDFTELKRLQLQLLQKIDELQHLNKNLEEFAYAASHDMKEPIRKILVFMDRLRERLSAKLDEENEHYFSRIEVSARRMNTLIEDLLTYSEMGHQSARSEAVALNTLLKLVLFDLELEIEQRNAVIEVNRLPTIQGHQRQLQQAFQNLISNALKYSKPDEAPHITITCSRVAGVNIPIQLTAEEREREFYLISITDRGIGFEQEDAERIFNVFTRLHVDERHKGTGVGLSIVRKVMYNHKGYVWANSAPNDGATFNLLFPV